LNSYGLAPTTPSRWRVYRFHHLGVHFETNILQLPPATTSWLKHLPLEGSLLSVWKNLQSRHCLPFGPFGLYCTSIREPPHYHFGRGGRTRTLDPRFWRPLLWPTELHPCVTFIHRLMVPLGRLERPTRGLGNRCSVQLSYRGFCYSSSLIAPVLLVEIGGFEPPTSAMRTQRSPS
jgi:hypothetical protein